jgi:hypothetical protein
MHVMRAGGTWLHDQATANLPTGSLSTDTSGEAASWFYRYLNPRSWQRLPIESQARLTFYMGHVPAVAAELILLRRPVMVTVLRHPITRTVSWLRWAQRVYPEHRDKSLEQIYEDPWWNQRFIDNHQVKLLSMTLEEALTPTWSGVVEPAEGEWLKEVLTPGHVLTREGAARFADLFRPNTARRVFELLGPNTHLVTCDDDRLRQALRAIDDFDVVGLTAHLPQFAASIEERLGWNVTTPRPPSSIEHQEPVAMAFRRRIAADNPYDMALHSYVRHRLEMRVAPRARVDSSGA